MPVAYNHVNINILKAGDILITYQKNFVSHCGICVGESSSGKATDVIHAAKSGIHTQSTVDYRQDSDVYRGNNLTTTEAKAIGEIAAKIAAAAQYGKARAWFGSWSASSTYGTGARARLAKYKERLGKEDQGWVKHVYCSELVILAYQLGLGDESHSLYIMKDAKHTLPSELRTYLGASGAWSNIGTYT